MTTHDDMVSVSTLDKIFAWFAAKPEALEPEPVQTPELQEDYAAQIETLQAEREAYAAKIAEYEAVQQRQERIAHFAAEFEGVQVKADLFEILADVPEEPANKLVELIRAIVEQARVANLTEDVGKAGAGEEGDPVAAFDAAVRKTMGDKNVSYPQAVSIVTNERPELFKAYAEA